ncbi:DUF1203 domain-containing protein [Actinosynnema sp. NPDC047251]|uniref:DUF1203 domain-containing protein n=1 Tax=Saccharothrix espanaensis (strain ATCC 51144 / DSM 44229 / JCM 9112 / NBRC 15066 / NRRL 15764) TaxID=1179773 RepID=K0JNS4_SACES|nr:DUF1203 domain-containing protein [Saccharothrix espanaensis]CCH27690.1 hypothetical protein BN6_03590 [Saccharothrix espanaensis DSM 44229]
MRIHALPTDVVERARKLAGTDEFHELRGESPGAPLRCCLRKAGVGEPLVLFRYTPTAGRGPYEELGPVFVHMLPCDGPDTVHDVPEAFRHNKRTLRAYDADGRIYEGGIAQPEELYEKIDELLNNSNVVEIQVRSVSHGCFLFSITAD